MNKEDALKMLKMMYYSQQLKNAVMPANYEEEQKIINKYDNEFPEKIFKMTWMDCSGIASLM